MASESEISDAMDKNISDQVYVDAIKNALNSLNKALYLAAHRNIICEIDTVRVGNINGAECISFSAEYSKRFS